MGATCPWGTVQGLGARTLPGMPAGLWGQGVVPGILRTWLPRWGGPAPPLKPLGETAFIEKKQFATNNVIGFRLRQKTGRLVKSSRYAKSCGGHTDEHGGSPSRAWPQRGQAAAAPRAPSQPLKCFTKAAVAAPALRGAKRKRRRKEGGSEPRWRLLQDPRGSS